MMDYKKIIECIKSKLKNPNARFVVTSEDENVHESYLLATCDGYLKIVVVILEFLQKVENGTIEFDDETKEYFDDKIKDIILPLPNNDACIVGMYLYKNHNQLLQALAEFTKNDNSTELSLKNDPDFDNKSLDGESS